MEKGQPMKITKRQLKSIIQEALEEDLYVVIGNAGQGRQNAWPRSAEPEALPKVEAQATADKLNKSQGNYGLMTIRYHIKPIASALEYISPGNEAYIGVEQLQYELGFVR